MSNKKRDISDFPTEQSRSLTSVAGNFENEANPQRDEMHELATALKDVAAKLASSKVCYLRQYHHVVS